MIISIFSDAQCSGGWIGYPGANTCYKFVANQQASWPDAQTLCRLYGGSLATFRTLADLTYVNGYRVMNYGE